MTFRLTILGSGPALPPVGKHPSAHVLNVHEQIFLIDAGEGVQARLRRYGVNAMALDRIFISHLHGDHVYGLFGLISSLGLLGRTKPLYLYGPAPIRAVVDNHLRLFEGHLPYEIVCRETDTEVQTLLHENRALEVWTVPLRHRLPACGYLFREKRPPRNLRKDLIERYDLSVDQIVAAKRGEDIVTADGKRIPNGEATYVPYAPRSYAYCSDTMFSRRVIEAVRGVELLYHEATFLAEDAARAEASGHSTTVQAATVALEAGARKLLIGHFSARYGDDVRFVAEARTVFPETYPAVEGESFDIPLDRAKE